MRLSLLPTIVLNCELYLLGRLFLTKYHIIYNSTLRPSFQVLELGQALGLFGQNREPSADSPMLA